MSVSSPVAVILGALVSNILAWMVMLLLTVLFFSSNAGQGDMQPLLHASTHVLQFACIGPTP